MTTTEEPASLPFDAQRHLDEIATLLASSSIRERVMLADTFEGILAVLAASGNEDAIMIGQVLGRLTMALMVVTREEARAEREG